MFGNLQNLQKIFQEKLSPEELELDEKRQLQIATCVLLLEVAHADDEFSQAEQDTIDKLVARRFQLNENETRELMDLADQQRRAEEDLYGFSRRINENYPRARKLAILDLLWEVVYSDGVLEAHEDALMHKMGTLLGVRHEELMAVKVQVKRRLAGS
jgi:uncharacterized tellurite resistance protein B-like protein